MPPGGLASASPRVRWSLFAVLVLVWGINYLFVREGLAFSAPLWLAVLRSGLGCVGVAVALPWIAAPRRLSRPELRDALLLGIPSTGLFFGLWFAAAGSVLPGVTAVVIYTFPLWVGLLSWPILHQRRGASSWIAIGTGFAGVVLIAQPWQATSVPPLAVLELIGGALSWAIGTVLFQRRFKPDAFDRANLYQMLGGFAVLVLLASALEPGSVPTVSPDLVVIVLWLGLAGTAFAYATWYALLASVPAARLSAYLFLVPVVSLAASAVVFDERLTALQFAGVVLVLGGLYGFQRSGIRTEVPPGTPEPSGRDDHR